jgi:hypothetical protein
MLETRTKDGSLRFTEVNLSLPRVDLKYKRILEVQGSKLLRNRIVCDMAEYDIGPDADLINKSLIVYPWTKLVIDAINNAASNAMQDFFFTGQPHSDENIQYQIDLWFNTAPFIHDVDVDNDMQVISLMEAVVLNIEANTISHNHKVFNPEWVKKVDPASTSQSDKINETYRRTVGSKIVDNRIVPGNDYFCSTIANNAFATDLGPRRQYLLRTTFENSETLTDSEDPILHPRNNQLSGVHLLTALMHFNSYTYEDCIVVSESAAKKLECIKRKRQTVKSFAPLFNLVSEGDTILPNDYIAGTEFGTTFRAEGIYRPCTAIEIKTSKTISSGHVAWVLSITYECTYSLSDGDKLSNREAGKGVVRIIPDKLMPSTSAGETIEVCVGPEAVTGRRSMGLYWEMMAHKYVDKTRLDSLDVDLYSPKPSFRELCDMGFGSSETLSIEGTKLPCNTFIGKIFWLRMNKHAIEAASCVGSEKPRNAHGLVIDKARKSGQKREPNKSIAMFSRNLEQNLFNSIKRDSNGHEQLRLMLEALED